MAKPRPVPGLDPDLAYGEAAARVLEVRCSELVEHAVGALDVGDIERVHDMRVASRRLRAALEAFHPCLPSDRAAAALKDVKELAAALGARRDRDVAIAALESLATAVPHPDRRGIGSLIAELREEQGAANEELVAAIDPERLRELDRQLAELAAAARRAASEPGGGKQ
jgi:CHAD domain-containing protein